MFVLGFFIAHAEDDSCRGGMNVAVFTICLEHHFIAAVERAHAQLDLREVDRQDDLTFRCLDKVSHADGIVRLARHVLCIGLAAVHSAGIRGKRKYLRMDAPRDDIDVFQISVNVGGLDLAPLAVFLNQREKLRHPGAILVAPFLEKRHGHVVRRLAVGFRGFQYGQVQISIEIILECLRGAVRPDVHVADDEGNLLAQPLHLSFRFRLSLLHEGKIHGNAVLLHDAEIYGGRAFHFLYESSVPR